MAPFVAALASFIAMLAIGRAAAAAKPPRRNCRRPTSTILSHLFIVLLPHGSREDSRWRICPLCAAQQCKQSHFRAFVGDHVRISEHDAVPKVGNSELLFVVARD